MNTITDKNENIVKRTSDVKGKVKNIVLIIVGAILIILSVICPFLPVFGIPGIVWRLIIGIIGILVLAICVCKLFLKKR